MGLVAQQPTPSPWGRWPPQQQQHGPEYVMMDSPSMLPYNPQPVAPAPLQPPVVSSPYVMANPYTSAPMTAMPAPAYPPQVSFGYVSYSEAVPPMDSGMKHEFHPPTPPQGMTRMTTSEPKIGHGPEFATELHAMPPTSPMGKQSRSPSIKGHALEEEDKRVPSPVPVAKTVTFNSSVNGAPMVSFNTEVDALMKVIQSKTETEQLVKITEEELVPEQQKYPKQRRAVKVIRKQFVCDVPDCNKRFAQRTQLTTHMRCHSGERPYTCNFAGCDSSFGQLGNLKVHERLHSGERPYACDQCHRRFAQRGNLKAHLETHKKTKRFVCKLDKCSKRFGQRGNLKAHQNHFHKATLQDLTAKFAAMTTDNIAMSKEDLEMWKYLATLYKNSNKGIKGRGVGRRVSTAAPTSSVSPVPTVQLHYPVQNASCHPPMMLDYQQGMANPPAGGMGRAPGMMMPMPHGREFQGPYDMFEMSDDSSTGGSTGNGPIYEAAGHGRGGFTYHRMF